MASWHLLTHPSFPRWLAFGVIQPFNFVAEGFVLLAGTSIGLQIARNRFAPRRMWRRAGVILLIHYGLVAFVVLLATAERSLGLAVQVASMPKSVWSILDLNYQPYLADILSVFVFFFAVTPIFEFIYRTFGARILIGVSVLLFFTARVFPLNAAGAFVFNSWQVFFVAGMLFGATYERQIVRLQSASRRTLVIWVVLFALACTVRVTIGGRDGAVLAGWQSYLAFNRNPLTVARIAYIGSEMVVIALFTLRWWHRLAESFFVQGIAALGRHSLEVFACSVVLDYLLKAFCTRFALAFPTNLIVWLFELVILFGLVYVLDGWNVGRPLRVRSSELAVN
jgi:hypothetical protein